MQKEKILAGRWCLGAFKNHRHLRVIELSELVSVRCSEMADKRSASVTIKSTAVDGWGQGPKPHFRFLGQISLVPRLDLPSKSGRVFATQALARLELRLT